MGRLRSYVQLFTVLSAAGILGMHIYASGANAQGADWLIGEPSAHINEHATTDSSTDNSDCSIRQTAVVNPSNGRVDVEDICITEAKNFRYGSYSSERTNYQRRFVVSFGFDSKAYVVTNMASHIGLHPIPETNDLVTRSLIYSGYNALTLYRNIPSMLKIKLVGGQVRGYEFTGSGQGRRFVDHPAGARAFGVSNNGKWALIEVVEKGIVRVNLETGERRFVTKNTTHYGYHALGTMRLAISNDGRYGAIFHADAGKGAYVIGMNDNCGREVQVGEAFGRLSNACPAASMKDAAIRGGGDSFWQFDYTHMPRFSDDGMQLQSWGGFFVDGKYVTKRLDFSAHGYVQPRLEYLALGDSYSSGEGDTETINGSDVKWYRYGTDNEENKLLGIPREKCHISMRSYPYLLASDMGLKLNSQWQTVACSGATAWDVKQQGSGAYWGQNNDNIPRLGEYSNRATLKSVALDEFIPGRQKQIEFVKKYQPKVITITMGGNDIGFGDKIAACTTPVTSKQTCRYAQGAGLQSLKDQISGQYNNLKSLYEELYYASNRQARIYVIGYPVFINGYSYAACGSNVGSLNSVEREMIQQSTIYMNRVIEQAASSAGVIYVDIEDSLDGHRLCDYGEKYITGVTNIFGRNGNERQESFHPNAKGHDAIFKAISAQLAGKSLLDYSVCSDGGVNCPDESATKESIEIPSFFGSQAGSEIVARYQTVSSGEAIQGGDIRIEVGDYTFRPQSEISLTIHSDPVSLGVYGVSDDGSAEFDAKIPSDVPTGYHTIVVAGETYSGEPMELEQVVLIVGNESDDLGDYTASDAQQSCDLLSAAPDVDGDNNRINGTCDLVAEETQVTQDLPDDSAGEDLEQPPVVASVADAASSQRSVRKMEEKDMISRGTYVGGHPLPGGEHGGSDEAVLGARPVSHADTQYYNTAPTAGAVPEIESKLLNYTYTILKLLVGAGAIILIKVRGMKPH